MDRIVEICSELTTEIGESSGLSQPMEEVNFDEESQMLDSPENTSNELLTELESLLETA